MVYESIPNLQIRKFGYFRSRNLFVQLKERETPIMANVNLSDGEWKIMNVLWEKESATITELTALLQEETGWDKHIIITMLNRMEKKGAVSYHTIGRAKQFYPLLLKNEVSIRETKGFLNKVYRGSIGMMVNAMVEDRALSKEDIAELYEILEQAEKAGGERQREKNNQS